MPATPLPRALATDSSSVTAVASDSTGQGVNSVAVARAGGVGSAACGRWRNRRLGLRRRRLNGCAQRLHHRGQHCDGRALCRRRYWPAARRPRQRAQAPCRPGRAAARHRRRSAPDRVPLPVPPAGAPPAISIIASTRCSNSSSIAAALSESATALARAMACAISPSDVRRLAIAARSSRTTASIRPSAARISAALAPTSAGSLDAGAPDMVSLCWDSVAILVRCERASPICTIDRSEANRSMAAAPQFSTDRFALKLGLFYAAYFFFGGVQLPFFPLWLEARGLDARTIGMVIAVPTLMRIVATPIITHAADRHRALKATLAIGSVVGLLGMTVVGLVDGPVAILAAFTWRWWRCRRCCRCRTPMRCRGWARAAAATARCGCGARSPSSPAMSARASSWRRSRPAI